MARLLARPQPQKQIEKKLSPRKALEVEARRIFAIFKTRGYDVDTNLKNYDIEYLRWLVANYGTEK